MNEILTKHFNNLHSNDPDSRYASFQYIIEITKQPVSWAYEVWNDLLSLLQQGDNHQRTVAVQVLSNLAKSDPEKRMLNDFEKLIIVTKDEKFVTARHSLQSLWKVAVAGEDLRKMVAGYFITRFDSCIAEKNCTLIRYDIVEAFRKIYNQVHDNELKNIAPSLAQREDDIKYRKKYLSLWKDLLKGPIGEINKK